MLFWDILFACMMYDRTANPEVCGGMVICQVMLF